MSSDPQRIKQLLFTLIYNSMKYTSNGFIKVEAKIKEKLGFDFVIKIKVSDSGCGMNNNIADGLFELFRNV